MKLTQLSNFICLLLTLLATSTGLGAQDGEIPNINVCPPQLVVQIDYEQECAGIINRIEKIPKGTVVNLKPKDMPVRRLRAGFGEHYYYNAGCDYIIEPERRLVYSCTDGEVGDRQKQEVPLLFGNVILFQWLDKTPDPETCEAFNGEHWWWNNATNQPTQGQLDDWYFLQNFQGFASDQYTLQFLSNLSVLGYFGWEYLSQEALPYWYVLEKRAGPRNCTGQLLNYEWLDVNPMFVESDNWFTSSSIEDITDVPVEDLLSLGRPVEGCVADGVSKLLLRFESIREDVFDFDFDLRYGRIDYPWGKFTHEIEGRHYGFVIYTPPEAYPEDLFGIHYGSATKAAVTRLPLSWIDAGGGMTSESVNLYLARPPVILVHGTFDNPENCWETPLTGQMSMREKLQSSWFRVSSVNYVSTNGKNESFLHGSSFRDNRNVVYENPGGIREAIDFFRDSLDFAATQADVIGHSMGGVLPRVYASDQGSFSEGYNTDYQRINNFQEGDINRLISIASTHHGADLSAFLHFVSEELDFDDLPFLEQLIANATVTGAYLGGLDLSGAVRNQIPGSPALRKIGETPVPAHAITCTVKDMADIVGNVGDEEQFANYANFLRALTFLIYFNSSTMDKYVLNLLDKYKQLPSSLRNTNQNRLQIPFDPLPPDRVTEARKPKNYPFFLQTIADVLDRGWFVYHLLNDQIDDSWVTVDRVYTTQYETSRIDIWDTEDLLQDVIQNENWNIIQDEYQVSLDEDKREADAIVNYFRQLIFKNAANDCVVRYESQTGGLSPAYVSSQFDNHIHSFAPRYPEIQERVVELLSTGMQHFDLNGWPEAGREMPVEFPDPGDQILQAAMRALTDEPVTDCEAICWSGYVPTHARAFARVAQRMNVVVLARPVNPDATVLIASDNATKPMNLKGKSSNWGPQRGFIPEEQKYSKLWFLYERAAERNPEIVKYNGEVVKSLEDPANIAVLRQLEKVYTCSGQQIVYNVYFDTLTADATQALALQDEQGQFYRWLIDVDNGCDDKVNCCPLDEQETLPPDHLVPLNVLANPALLDENGKPRFYTADYDLLAIGFYDKALDGYEDDAYDDVNSTIGKIPRFSQSDFHPETGYITGDQEALVDSLNKEVRISGYDGGNVTHHGPENQYYIVGRPDKGSPYVDYPIIAFEPDPQSSVGKIMAIPKGPPGFRDRFLKRYMAKKRREGYNLYPNLVAGGWRWDHYHKYSFEKGWDDRDAPDLTYAPEEIPQPASEDCECSIEEKFTPLPGDIGDPQAFGKINIFPNPTGQRLNVVLESKIDQPGNYYISDLFGRIVRQGSLRLVKGENHLTIPLEHTGLRIGILFIKAGPSVTSTKFIIESN